eukprot:GHUV01021026.1.p2 GENE.GHUV01021026.1~~GHUV01021026.1.p2  ORF type:complete len:134 (+),score=57.78 GHUV01021026.1:1173-1574(+)
MKQYSRSRCASSNWSNSSNNAPIAEEARARYGRAVSCTEAGSVCGQTVQSKTAGHVRTAATAAAVQHYQTEGVPGMAGPCSILQQLASMNRPDEAAQLVEVQMQQQEQQQQQCSKSRHSVCHAWQSLVLYCSS